MYSLCNSLLVDIDDTGFEPLARVLHTWGNKSLWFWFHSNLEKMRNMLHCIQSDKFLGNNNLIYVSTCDLPIRSVKNVENIDE